MISVALKKIRGYYTLHVVVKETTKGSKRKRMRIQTPQTQIKEPCL